jgi:hypothetical protein
MCDRGIRWGVAAAAKSSKPVPHATPATTTPAAPSFAAASRPTHTTTHPLSLPRPPPSRPSPAGLLSDCAGRGKRTRVRCRWRFRLLCRGAGEPRRPPLLRHPERPPASLPRMQAEPHPTLCCRPLPRALSFPHARLAASPRPWRRRLLPSPPSATPLSPAPPPLSSVPRFFPRPLFMHSSLRPPEPALAPAQNPNPLAGQVKLLLRRLEATQAEAAAAVATAVPAPAPSTASRTPPLPADDGRDETVRALNHQVRDAPWVRLERGRIARFDHSALPLLAARTPGGEREAQLDVLLAQPNPLFLSPPATHTRTFYCRRHRFKLLAPLLLSSPYNQSFAHVLLPFRSTPQSAPLATTFDRSPPDPPSPSQLTPGDRWTS